ncbi:MAG: DUF2240 family protein [Candidatus Helarchaeota archaeon]
MQTRDVLWTISIPFRIYNTKELDINTFIFTLSFDAALPNCKVSIARKLITLALEKGFVEWVNGKNTLRAKFELWKPKLFPPAWKPDFSNLEKVPMVDLIPLDISKEYKPEPLPQLRKTEYFEKTQLYTSKPPKLGEEVPPVEPKEAPPKKKPEKKKKPLPSKKKVPSKKKKTKEKEKRKGQKSISDFFR